MSAITRLNRSGPIAFSQLTTGTPYGAINNLIDNVVGTPSTQNISLSASLSLLRRNTGDPTTDTVESLGLGIGLVSLDTINDSKMSEFYGGNYLSSSVKEYGSNNGVWHLEFYPDSVVPNSNYLTRETSSRVYRYSVYSKLTATPSADFQLQYSYVKSNDSDEYISNFVKTKTYKVVLKDVVSNAFTSSIFTGSCNQPSTVGTSVLFSSNNTTTYDAAVTSVRNLVNASGDITQGQRSDLNNVLDILPKLVPSPETYNLNGYSRVATGPWTGGGTRTFNIEGFIANIIGGGRYFAGYVTATGGDGSTPLTNYNYAISDSVTTNKNASLSISAIAPSSTSGCGSIPSLTVSDTAVSQKCLIPAQLTNSPTSANQVRFSGSAIFFNPSTNGYNASITLNADWINLANNQSLYAAPGGIAQLLPSFNPSTFTLTPGQSKIVQYGFGLPYYNQIYQSSSFSARGTYTAVFATSPSSTTLTGKITATLDKSVCYVAAPNPIDQKEGGGCPAAWQSMETLERGFIPAREIEVGMHLRDPEPNVWNEVTVAYISRSPIYRTIIEGNIFDVDSSHKWYVGNDNWKVVTDIKAGDILIGIRGEQLTVNDSYLLHEDEEYMHLNCENQRFVMGTNVIGHNFPVKAVDVAIIK